MKDFNQQKKDLSTHDFSLWCRTEEGLRAYCMSKGYKLDKCEIELRALQHIHEADSIEAWEIALSAAKVKVYDDFEDIPDVLRDREKREALEVKVAEDLMVIAGFPPPHWNKVAECLTCGPILYKEKTIVHSCPWCESGFMNQITIEDL